jgi:hypothetical protein
MQKLASFYEFMELGGAIYQDFLVCDALRNFDRKNEVSRSLLIPSGNCGGRWRCVGGAVDFDSLKLGRLEPEILRRFMPTG